MAMKAKLETEEGKARYARRQQSVEPVFGIIKSAMGFTRFRLRGLQTPPQNGRWWHSPTTAAGCIA
jgi:hypothetical protein